MPAFQDNCTLDGMVRYLCQCDETFGPPNTGSKSYPASNYSGRLEAPTNNKKSPPKPNITKVICHRCNWKDHYASSCNSKTGKSQRGVEEELSTSTQSTKFPPDLLFTPDTGFSGNALHQVLVNNVHMVQTRSKVQASQEATKEVSKPYACQLLDDAPDTEPQCSSDATPFRGVNVAIPMETIKDHHPELCDSIFEFLSTANNLYIHLCTYADIFVNKLKV
ncbi:hypothetical protein DSO57_1000105 [Entomophthora muscae]|uniref:Uncharacterized protein n=1 Tax=Entomophthora muscae TaxID=34485 RepID=A0ACC2SN40_9FUNG|nr:hypothetical protein DSO57_1000105 [Entomophthora muscae]